jgi:hypothetical protein
VQLQIAALRQELALRHGHRARAVGVLHAEHVHGAVGLDAVVAAEIHLGGLVEADLRFQRSVEEGDDDRGKSGSD